VAMIETELSEPYSIFLYRHFVNDFPKLSIVALCGEDIVGCIIGKIEEEAGEKKGYIAMIVTKSSFRKRGIAKRLVEEFNEKVREMGVYEVVLETECVNRGALRLYECKQAG
jgi:peptide alpha-N-acetyltransferase